MNPIEKDFKLLNKRILNYIYVLIDKYNKSSVYYKRVTRSILASELYAISEGLNIASAIKTTIK
ncbi:uncharacterized protein RAG0_17519 [Rhynchosporium agropyri]|uniref:Uncharacterized protein n=1 Tax=Rhynchosporium agropyri TaxID=914238 RepID=A0A1E1LVJ3_9HELO|nr:uncharacterized protein RAG0_17519 [Rhynchosporium agropyri]